MYSKNGRFLAADAVDSKSNAASKALHVVADADASQTNEDFIVSEPVCHVSLMEMIYQFLVHTIDIKHSNLIDKLVAKHILSPGEKHMIKVQKKTDAKVNSLMMSLRKKSATQFESFLTTLSETGQQSVANVVRQTLDTVGQTGHNPFQYSRGMLANSSDSQTSFAFALLLRRLINYRIIIIIIIIIINSLNSIADVIQNVTNTLYC